MGELLAKLVELFADKDKKIGVRFYLVLVVLIVLSPGIVDYFYENTRLSQEIELLNKVKDVDITKLSDQRLTEIYNNIVGELQRTTTTPQITQGNNSTQTPQDFFSIHNFWKFLTGASAWLLMLLISLFAKYESAKSRIQSIFVILLFAVICGIVGIAIPDLNPITINYIAFPVLQFIIVAVVAVRISNRKKS